MVAVVQEGRKNGTKQDGGPRSQRSKAAVGDCAAQLICIFQRWTNPQNPAKLLLFGGLQA